MQLTKYVSKIIPLVSHFSSHINDELLFLSNSYQTHQHMQKMLTISKCPLYAAIIRHVLLYLFAIFMLALWYVRYLTISNRPSKQAALRGVELVFVGWLTSAPALTSSLTTFKCPTNIICTIKSSIDVNIESFGNNNIL